MNSVITKYIYKFFSKNASRIISILSKIKFISKSILYNSHKKLLISKISKKDSINIIFFVYKLGMWKYDGLMRLLIENKHFNPIIIPSIRETDDILHSHLEHDSIIKYCINNGYPYRNGYDFMNNSFADITDFNPDIVVYTQPYNQDNSNWRIDKFKNKSLFIYTPYGLSVTDAKHLYDTYLINIAWKIFTANILESKILIKNRTLKYNNTIVTGASIYDEIRNADINKSPWKDKNKIKIIWAPHHSIDDKFSFCNSTFESICVSMVKLAKKYQDKIEVAFKPHPVLFDRLAEKWGYTKVSQYYDLWRTMQNTFVCDGTYNELFAFSDGMIHDSCSFVGEYLYTNKPVMYICRDKGIPSGINNNFGIECFMQHYKGYSIDDIEDFIISLLNKQDPLKYKRENFLNKYLLPPNNIDVANNMYNEFLKLIK